MHQYKTLRVSMRHVNMNTSSAIRQITNEPLFQSHQYLQVAQLFKQCYWIKSTPTLTNFRHCKIFNSCSRAAIPLY